MPLLYWAHGYTEIALGVFLDYHKSVIPRKYLRDLAFRIVNQVTPLFLRETSSISLNAPRIILRLKKIKKIPYAVGSLMYAQVCTRPDIVHIVRMLGR